MNFWDRITTLWQPCLRFFDGMIDRIGVLTVAAITFLTGVIPGVNTLDPVLLGQAGATFAYAPWYIVTSPFRPRSSLDVEAAMMKAGGFMRGITHSREDYARLPEANIEWERIDVPYPFGADGVTLTGDYESIRQQIIDRRTMGLKTMILTPDPWEFWDRGIDPRTPEGEAAVIAVTKFMVQDLKPYVHAVQVANELGALRFSYPLNVEECAHFLAVLFEALHPIKGDLLVGYNTAGPQMDLTTLLRPYLSYCDYVGIDIYIGCFSDMANWMLLYDLYANLMWSYTGKPVVIAEFGYMSGGVPKTRVEKDALLRERYGFESEVALRADPAGFLAAVEQTNPWMADYINRYAGDDLIGFLFSLEFAAHLYAELPAGYVIKKYPHTPEGQAGFFADCIPRLAKYPFVIGMFMYEWRDADICYVCGQADCPVETRWGLVDREGNPKPAFYAVKEAYGKLM